MENKSQLALSIIVFFVILINYYHPFEEKQGAKSNLNRADQAIHKQYITAGRKLYIMHCACCHQEDGTGLRKLFPPLATPGALPHAIDRTIYIIHQGLSGEIVVNGQIYNQPMPANKHLQDVEIAKIVTYLYTTWGGRPRTLIKAAYVNEVLKSYG